MRAWPFGWSLFATATYIKGHWHCTGGASLREPVAVPLDKVPQPPGEFHAQALHVVRAVDVRRGFLQTSTISFLRLLPAPPRERLLQPVAHPRDGLNAKHAKYQTARCCEISMSVQCARVEARGAIIMEGPTDRNSTTLSAIRSAIP